MALTYTPGQGDDIGHTQSIVVSIFFLTFLAVVLAMVWWRFHQAQVGLKAHREATHTYCRRSWCSQGKQP